MTRRIAWGLLGAMAMLGVMLGGCTTIRALGSATGDQHPEDCEWVVVETARTQPTLFLCCKSPGRDAPHCVQAVWATQSVDGR